MHFLIGGYVAASYIAGVHFFQPHKPTVYGVLMFTLSPVTVPATLAVLLLVYP